MNIAHLLVHLDGDAAWQKRVVLVVGMRRYVKALSAQVLRFADMIAHVELGIPGDQAAFIKTETQLREKATQNQERAKAVAEIKAALVEQKTAKDDAVSRQRTQLKELTDQLTKVKNEVDELLVKQTGLEKQLFEIQREVGLTLEEVYRLEILLERVERERFGLPPIAKP
jgi:chromosome segregation ATPase